MNPAATQPLAQDGPGRKQHGGEAGRREAGRRGGAAARPPTCVSPIR